LVRLLAVFFLEASMPAGAWQLGHQYVVRGSSEPWFWTWMSVPQLWHGRPARS
jgi:hypothetical protein